MKTVGDARAGVASDLAAESLARTGRLRFRSAGTSMLPSLRPGDVLDFVAPDGPIAPGDIVLWRREDRLFVHRVVGSVDGHVRTRGDALLHADPPVSHAEVLGTLESYERRGRRRPTPRLGTLGHCWGWCLRRSDAATRMFLRWHRLTERLRA
jgi:hypothetical protein